MEIQAIPFLFNSILTIDVSYVHINGIPIIFLYALHLELPHFTARRCTNCQRCMVIFTCWNKELWLVQEAARRQHAQSVQFNLLWRGLKYAIQRI